MKLIDDKGKLFGLINVIDLAIVLVVVALVAGIVIKMGSTDDKPKESKWYMVTVYCEDVQGNVAENLKPNDRIVYGNVYVDGYVVSVEEFPAKDTVVLPDGTLMEVEKPGYSDILVKVKVLYQGNDNLIMLGKYQVNIGKSFAMKTNRVEVPGIVYDIEEL
ncbi:MAG: DUF4330 domain-containing protein [Clostridia bacterium]|jgi:hypothetical protein|nr:DUF4330 domain-containing protein [Clostridiaceae bacterium]